VGFFGSAMKVFSEVRQNLDLEFCAQIRAMSNERELCRFRGSRPICGLLRVRKRATPGVSAPYAADIRVGRRRPHPRALAQVVAGTVNSGPICGATAAASRNASVTRLAPCQSRSFTTTSLKISAPILYIWPLVPLSFSNHTGLLRPWTDTPNISSIFLEDLTLAAQH
jgi:hypothetical protein